jgi:hypothetical protein
VVYRRVAAEELGTAEAVADQRLVGVMGRLKAVVMSWVVVVYMAAAQTIVDDIVAEMVVHIDLVEAAGLDQGMLDMKAYPLSDLCRSTLAEEVACSVAALHTYHLAHY